MNLNRTINILIYLCAGVFLIGVLFRIMHWPWSFELLIGSSLAGSILYLVKYLIRGERNWKDHLKLGFAALFTCNVFFRLTHTPGTFALTALMASILIILIVSGELSFTWNKQKGNKITINVIFNRLSSVLIIFGFIFSVMHWPGSSVMLVAGFIILAASFLFDSFINKEDDEEID